jgi:hypothetical protein
MGHEFFFESGSNASRIEDTLIATNEATFNQLLHFLEAWPMQIKK